MSVKKLSLALCAMSMFMGTSAFADCGLRSTVLGPSNTVYSDGIPVPLSQSAVIGAPACGTTMLSQPAVIGAPACGTTVLSQPAVMAAPAPAMPIGPICRGRTFFDLQLLGLRLLHFGNRRCAAMLPTTTSMSAVVAPTMCAPATTCAPATVCPTQSETVQSQPAVVQPESKTIMLHDKEVKTTTTRIYRLR